MLEALVLLLVGVSLKGIGDRPFVVDGGGDPYASEFLLVATDVGIYALDRNAGTWSRITAASGLPANRVRILGLDDGILWAATDSGLASADVRLNDWRAYDLTGRMTGLGFDDDYTWVGTDSGLFRYDKYIEEWQPVDTRPVAGLLVAEGDVWVATDSAVLRYAREFDRLDDARAPAGRYEQLFATPGRIWFLGRERFAAFDPASGAWTSYAGVGYDDWASVGDTAMVVADRRVLLYDPNTDAWGPLREVEPFGAILGIEATNDQLLLATPTGLVRYTWADRSRELDSRATGMTADSLIDVFRDGSYVYVLTGRDIQYLDRATGTWRAEELTAPTGRGRTLFWLDDAGAHAGFVPGTDLRLGGRASFEATHDLTDTLPTTRDDVNLNLTGLHGSGRGLALFYDNTDKDLLDYGLGYRGIDDDLLYRANGGFLTADWYEFDLVPRFTTLGGNARLRLADHALGIQAGRIQSRTATDFFRGRTFAKTVERRDNQYLSRTVYRVSAAPDPTFVPTDDTVFVDDRNPATNDPGTRVGWTVGGTTGDFDVLVRGTDYSIETGEAAPGLIHFSVPRAASDFIVYRDDHLTSVMQDSSMSLACVNYYYFAPGIVPGTFRLAITDTQSDRLVALSDYRLDTDGDGLVDREFINHDLGLLTFPDERPFQGPLSDNRSRYALTATFRTRSTFYQLSRAPVDRGSERVLVDGELMASGYDYAIDYTSGTLLFLRDDAVTDFSDVEVSYSVVDRECEDLVVSAQPEIALGPGITVAPGFTRVEDANLFHLSGRAESGRNSDRGFTAVPQAAVTPAGHWATRHEVTGRYGMWSSSLVYEGYSDSFDGFGSRVRRYGDVDHSGAFALNTRPLAGFDLGGRIQYDLQDSSGSVRPVRYASARAAYARRNRGPYGYLLYGDDRLPDRYRRRLAANAGTYLTLFETTTRLDLLVRDTRDRVTADSVGGDESDVRADRSFEYIADVNFKAGVPVVLDIRFRHNGLSADGRARGSEEEVRGRFNLGIVPGLYYTGSYNLEATRTVFAQAADLELGQYLYNNLDIAPGSWWSGLSPVNFSIGTGSSFDQYLNGLPAGFDRPVLVFSPLDDRPTSSAGRTASIYGIVDLRPLPELTVWARHGVNRSGTGRFRLPELRPTSEDEVRVDWEPRRAGRFTGRWQRRADSNLPARTTDNWFLEWNRGWTGVVRTGVTGSWRSGTGRYPTAVTGDSEQAAGIETQLRLSSRNFATVSLAGTRSVAIDGGTGYKITPGAGFNVNLVRFLYLRLDWQSDFVPGSAPVHLLIGRITGQF